MYTPHVCLFKVHLRASAIWLSLGWSYGIVHGDVFMVFDKMIYKLLLNHELVG